MKFTSTTAAIVLATFAAVTSAATLPAAAAATTVAILLAPTKTQELAARQSMTVDSTHADKETADRALSDNREDGRRKLSGTTANCKTSACHTCMNAATTASIAEVIGCGIVGTAAEVGSAGSATGFVVAGFAACETAVVANMAKSVVECEALP